MGLGIFMIYIMSLLIYGIIAVTGFLLLGISVFFFKKKLEKWDLLKNILCVIGIIIGIVLIANYIMIFVRFTMDVVDFINNPPVGLFISPTI